MTFNWDLTIEKTLARCRATTPIAYQFSKDAAPNTLTLLKPHGSINWFDRDALIKTGLAGTTDLDGKLNSVDFPVMLFSRDQIKSTPVIVPPLANKEFSEYPVFQNTWASVYRALSSATVLTILGYSLPREDQFSRFVFRRALRNNALAAQRGDKPPLKVIVVNPDETTEGTFARLVGRDATTFSFHRALFQDFVDSLPT